MASTTPPGSPPRKTTELSHQRSPKSGTTEDLEHLSRRFPDLKSPNSYHTLTNKHLEVFLEMSDKLAEADRCFRAGMWNLCRWRCNEITGQEGSAAIEARAFMLLARREVTPAANNRSFYAEAAIDCWQKVIDRKGVSRFPIGEAKELQREAGKMLEEADLAAGNAISSGEVVAEKEIPGSEMML